MSLNSRPRKIDSLLSERLNALNEQNDVLREAEGAFLELDANKKALLAQLTIKAQGKSFAEREALALASDDWRDFRAAHVAAETTFNFERRRFAILESAYLAAHATYKNEEQVIRKGGAA